MIDRSNPILRCGALAALALVALALAGPAQADIVGRLRFSVKNADDEKPLANAKIVLKDSAGVNPDVTLTTDATGMVTSSQLSARAWQATTTAEKADTFEPDARTVTVVADTTTEVEVLLEPLKEKTIVIKGARTLVSKSDTTNDQKVTQQQIQQFPTTGANPQNLGKVLLQDPGFVMDSDNQIHPRGEHNSTTLFLNGFELPDVLAGRAGAFVVPNTLQSLDIMTGAYAPEYGGETAAILNITLRSGTIVPFEQAFLEGGGYSTWDGDITFGGQGGRAIGAPDAKGNVPRAFGYFVDINARTTNNAFEPPQPDDQTAHNHGESEAYFGNFDYSAGSRDHFNFTVNSAPAYTQVANRAGLPSSFANVGQGFGFGGFRNPDGTNPAPVDPNGIGVTVGPLASQQGLGQDDYVRDVNDFGVLSWRHDLNPHLNSLLSFALVHSGQSILNNNSAVPLGSLPLDQSIEYNPDIVRNYHHEQGQGSLTWTAGAHTVKGGLLYDGEEGDESYNISPQSTFALDFLELVDPILAPAATATNQTDANGNTVYTVNPGALTPTLVVHRSGFYSAGYMQDTWNISRRFTANYGVRLDWYDQKQTTSLGSQQPPVDRGEVSPRINFAYLVAPRTIARASYNHLFIQPPLAQGSIIGQAIQPETLNQYDVDIQRQLNSTQVVKLAYYAKNMHNQIDTGLLIPNTQIGAYAAVNFTEGDVHGVELNWQLQPRTYNGLAAYVSYTNSIAKPGGVIDGVPTAPAPVYNDHDQLNTISTGAAYTFKSGAMVGLDFYYGSGLGSSGISNNNASNTAPRNSNSHLNMTLSTGPGLFGGGPVNGHGGLSLIIENIYDDRSVINFDSGFSGTRFDQGRQILLSVFGKF